VLIRFNDRLERSSFTSLLREKCAVRGVSFAGPEDFFRNSMLAHVQATWQQWLGPLVPGLPPYETVIAELRPQVELLFGSG